MKPLEKGLFGERLRMLRRKEVMNQTELAKILDVDVSTISRWETGLTLPDDNVINAICEHFKKPYEFFFEKDFPRALELLGYDRDQTVVDVWKSFNDFSTYVQDLEIKTIKDPLISRIMKLGTKGRARLENIIKEIEAADKTESVESRKGAPRK